MQGNLIHLINSFDERLVERLNQLNQITLPSYGTSAFSIFSVQVQSTRKQCWASTQPHKMYFKMTTTQPNFLILVSFFSEDITSSTDTIHCKNNPWERGEAVFFFSEPPSIDLKWQYVYFGFGKLPLEGLKGQISLYTIEQHFSNYRLFTKRQDLI